MSRPGPQDAPERELPRNDEDESVILGTCLQDAELAQVAADHLSGDEFYLDGHRAIFRKVRAALDNGQAPDLGTVAELLRTDAAASAQVQGLQSTEPAVYLAGLDGFRVWNRPGMVQACERIRKLHARRLLIQDGRRIVQDAAEPDADPAQLAERLHSMADRTATGAASLERFAAAARSASEFMAHPFPQPPSLLGDGLLRAGGFGILYGKPGLGKTWHALVMARAIARGEPWLGIPTILGGARVGFLELELPGYTMQERLRVVTGGVLAPEDDRLIVVARPELRGMVDLCRSEDRLSLKHWIRHDRLDLLILDALSRAHTADESSGSSDELGGVLAELDALRHDTGCALELIHHERKSGKDRGNDDNDLDALRGSSRLQSDPTLLIRVREMRGMRCLRFPKVNEGPTPEPIWYRIGEDGLPVVVEAPELVAAGNQERVLAAITEAAGLVTRDQLQERAKLSRATVAKHLSALIESGKVRKVGDNRATAYCLPAYVPNLPSIDSWAGEDEDTATG